MKDTNLSRTILLSFVVIMIFLTSVPACSSGPENELVGDWSLNWFISIWVAVGKSSLFVDSERVRLLSFSVSES